MMAADSGNLRGPSVRNGTCTSTQTGLLLDVMIVCCCAVHCSAVHCSAAHNARQHLAGPSMAMHATSDRLFHHT
jgi:hypothetical protein